MLSDIAKRDVLAELDARGSKIAANRWLAIVSKLFAWALSRDDDAIQYLEASRPDI